MNKLILLMSLCVVTSNTLSEGLNKAMKFQSENKILSKLADWVYENESRLVLEAEFEGRLELREAEFIDAWFDAQIENPMSDDDYDMLEREFLGFASTGEGGEFYVWNYKGLEGSPPVIFLGSSGEYDMVAPSLNDFVCMLGHGKYFVADYETLNVEWEDYSGEDKALYLKDSKKFLKSFSSLVECTSFEKSLEKMSNHKNFKSMVDDFVKRNSQ